jgi:hypothetical protein
MHNTQAVPCLRWLCSGTCLPQVVTRGHNLVDKWGHPLWKGGIHPAKARGHLTPLLWANPGKAGTTSQNKWGLPQNWGYPCTKCKNIFTHIVLLEVEHVAVEELSTQWLLWQKYKNSTAMHSEGWQSLSHRDA